MITDALNYLADNVVFFATGTISDVIDRGATAPAATQYSPDPISHAYLVLQTGTTAYAGGTSVQFDLVSATDAALTTGVVVHASTGAVVIASLGANKAVAILPLPPGDYKRYIGLKATAVGSTTAGTLRAFITNNVNAYRAMASNNPKARV